MGGSASVPTILMSVSNSDSEGSAPQSSPSCSKLSPSFYAHGLPPTCPDGLRLHMDSDVKVDSLGIYRRPLRGKGTVNHDFLIVEVAYIKKETGARYRGVGFIWAEKVLDNNMGRIEFRCSSEFHVAKGSSLQREGECLANGDVAGEMKHTIGLEGCGMIPMKTLYDILSAPPSVYSIMRQNCWEYAEKTFRRLVEEFATLPNTENEKKHSLQSYLAGLPKLQLPADALKFNPAVIPFLCGGAGSVALAGIGYTQIMVATSYPIGLVSTGIAEELALTATPWSLPTFLTYFGKDLLMCVGLSSSLSAVILFGAGVYKLYQVVEAGRVSE